MEKVSNSMRGWGKRLWATVKLGTPCCSLHVGLLLMGSPVWLMIFLLHVALSITSLALNPVGLLFQVSLNCMFPSFSLASVLNTSLSVCSSSMPLPVRHSLSDLIEACAALVVPHKCSFHILRVYDELIIRVINAGTHPFITFGFILLLF